MALTPSSEVQSYLGFSKSSTPHAKNSISRTRALVATFENSLPVS